MSSRRSHIRRDANPTLLRDGERPASELAEPFGVSFGAISQHLKVLKEAELVSERRAGRQRIYRLHAQPLAEVVSWVDEFERFFEARLDALARHLDCKHRQKKR